MPHAMPRAVMTDGVGADGRCLKVWISHHAGLAEPWVARVVFESDWRGENLQDWETRATTPDRLVAILAAWDPRPLIIGIHGSPAPPAMEARRTQLEANWRGLVGKVERRLKEAAAS